MSDHRPETRTLKGPRRSPSVGKNTESELSVDHSENGLNVWASLSSLPFGSSGVENHPVTVQDSGLSSTLPA